MRSLHKFRAAALTLFALALILVQSGSAQERMSDKDIENTFKNLIQDSKLFQSSFNSAVSKSTVRKTSQAKDAKTLVKTFQNQTRSALSVFQQSKKADNTLPVLLSSAKQIDGFLATVPLGGVTTSQWAKCKSELTLLTTAFGMAPPAN